MIRRSGGWLDLMFAERATVPLIACRAVWWLVLFEGVGKGRIIYVLVIDDPWVAMSELDFRSDVRLTFRLIVRL